jgi:hypothetical protein
MDATRQRLLAESVRRSELGARAATALASFEKAGLNSDPNAINLWTQARVHLCVGLACNAGAKELSNQPKE